jgi:hypothetical protein
VRFNRDAVVSDSQGLPRYAATPGSNPTDLRTPAGFRQHVAAVLHGTLLQAFSHVGQMQIIAHALIRFTDSRLYAHLVAQISTAAKRRQTMTIRDKLLAIEKVRPQESAAGDNLLIAKDSPPFICFLFDHRGTHDRYSCSAAFSFTLQYPSSPLELFEHLFRRFDPSRDLT